MDVGGAIEGRGHWAQGLGRGRAIGAESRGGCSQTRCPDGTRSVHSGVQLAGVLLQRDQGSADPAAEAGAVLALQPAPALAHLPFLLPRGLQQLQPAALLERRLPDGWVPGPWGSIGGWGGEGDVAGLCSHSA